VINNHYHKFSLLVLPLFSINHHTISQQIMSRVVVKLYPRIIHFHNIVVKLYLVHCNGIAIPND
jgi:hypothetical protein